MALSVKDELVLLRKRARRRLVGAVVLVLIAILSLWHIITWLPEQHTQLESIEIIRPAAQPATPESGLAATAPLNHSPITGADQTQEQRLSDHPTDLIASLSSPPPSMSASAPPSAAVQPKAKSKPRPAAGTAASKPKAQTAPDPAAILEGRMQNTQTPPPVALPKSPAVIQLAALSDIEKAKILRAKLSSLGVAIHINKVHTPKGEIIRVRAGPFKDRTEAERILQKLSQSGISGIIIATP